MAAIVCIDHFHYLLIDLAWIVNKCLYIETMAYIIISLSLCDHAYQTSVPIASLGTLLGHLIIRDKPFLCC